MPQHSVSIESLEEVKQHSRHVHNLVTILENIILPVRVG